MADSANKQSYDKLIDVIAHGCQSLAYRVGKLEGRGVTSSCPSHERHTAPLSEHVRGAGQL